MDPILKDMAHPSAGPSTKKGPPDNQEASVAPPDTAPPGESFIPPTPPEQDIDASVIIPVPKFGRNSQPPGDFAKYVMSLPATFEYKSKALEIMVKMPAQREPLLQEGYPLLEKGIKLLDLLSKPPSCAESAVLQIVGQVAKEKCGPCRDGVGLWTECVILPEPNGGLSCCSNCHIDYREAQCDHNVAAPRDASPPRKRRRTKDETVNTLHNEAQVEEWRQCLEEAESSQESTEGLIRKMRGHLQQNLDLQARLRLNMAEVPGLYTPRVREQAVDLQRKIYEMFKIMIFLETRLQEILQSRGSVFRWAETTETTEEP